MDKTLSADKAIQISTKLNNQGKRIVLAGGCFDILHIGHIAFLQKAKEQGDVLFVLIEHDETIKKSKGENRPINSQEDRSKILSHIDIIDYVVLLPNVKNDKTYDDLVINIKPAIIATTAGDININHK